MNEKPYFGLGWRPIELWGGGNSFLLIVKELTRTSLGMGEIAIFRKSSCFMHSNFIVVLLIWRVDGHPALKSVTFQYLNWLHSTATGILVSDIGRIIPYRAIIALITEQI